jgi:hypothetical protein
MRILSIMPKGRSEALIPEAPVVSHEAAAPARGIALALAAGSLVWALLLAAIAWF